MRTLFAVTKRITIHRRRPLRAARRCYDLRRDPDFVAPRAFLRALGLDADAVFRADFPGRLDRLAAVAGLRGDFFGAAFGLRLAAVLTFFATLRAAFFTFLAAVFAARVTFRATFVAPVAAFFVAFLTPFVARFTAFLTPVFATFFPPGLGAETGAVA